MIYLRAAVHVAIIALLLAGAMLLLEARRTVAIYAALPAIVDLAIARESSNIRRAAEQEIDKLRHTTQVELRVSRAEAVAESAAWRALVGAMGKDAVNTADARLGALEKPLSGAMVELLSKTEQLAAPLAATLRNTERITAQAAETSELLLDCESMGPSCLPNRIVGTLNATERTMQAVERTARSVDKATPELAAAAVKTSENVAGITGDVRTATAAYVRPEKWYWKALKAVSVVGWARR